MTRPPPTPCQRCRAERDALREQVAKLTERLERAGREIAQMACEWQGETKAYQVLAHQTLAARAVLDACAALTDLDFEYPLADGIGAVLEAEQARRRVLPSKP